MGIRYKAFDEFIMRTPAFSVERWRAYMQELGTGNWNFLLDDTYFLEALLVASPVLYDEVLRYKSGSLPQKEEARLKSSVLKYFTRMAWRCTPFGLFSACSVGKLSNKTEIVLPSQEHFKRLTRLDMNYLCSLIQHIEKDDEMRKILKYFTNNSIYPVGDQLRYVEYHYKNAIRKHTIVSVEDSRYLQIILQQALHGKTVKELAACITDPDISNEDATEFVLELINNQILVSELYPSVTGTDILKKLVQREEPLFNRIKEIDQNLTKISKCSIGQTQLLYDNIIAHIKEIGASFDPKYLFQVDMVKEPIKAEISKEITDDLLDAVSFLNRLTPNNQNPTVAEFIRAFYNRYEEREMPLLQVLDNEFGIGYPVSNQGDIAPLLDNFSIPERQNPSQQQIGWSFFYSILNQKLIESYKQRKYEIVLQEKDFNLQDVKATWDDIPDTFAIMCKVFAFQNNYKKIFFTSCGGSSAANLSGRFCHADSKIEDLVQKITKKEQYLQKNCILAEIVHLPESRIGNILFRPVIRKYEIPYLAQSSVNQECQIPLSDLYISIKNSKIILRSRNLGKQIIPHLTTAHNFSMHSMPAYHFLCDMQTKGLRAGFAFRWSEITNDYPFLPRVSYKNVIFSLARWIVNTADFKEMLQKDEDLYIVNTITKWRSENLMPQYVVLPDHDNTLFIDMDNILNVRMLFNVVKKRPNFMLQEFPYEKDLLFVKDMQGGSYVNEFIFGFYKTDES